MAPRPTKASRGRTPSRASWAAASTTTPWPFMPRSPATMPTSSASPGAPKRAPHLGIGWPGRVSVRVGATRQRDEPLGRHQPRGRILPADRVGDGDDERGGLAVEPSVGGVGADDLDDVPCPHDRPRRTRQPIRHRGQPVLLAAMDVHDVGLLKQAREVPDVGDVGHGLDSARQRQRLDRLHSLGTRAGDHGVGALAPTHERHQRGRGPRALESCGPPSTRRRTSHGRRRRFRIRM